MNSNSGEDFWDLKPPWCQPWSIISFGIFIFVFIWKFFNNIIIDWIVGFLIITWWVIFLLLAPIGYKNISNTK